MPITPDDKDWTWVLDRPCPECGFDASATAVDEISPMIRATAARWVEILAQSPELTRRPTDERWSTLEYACHVRDVFRIYDERLALMMREDDPLFPNWDQDATALEQDYNGQDPARVGDELDAAAHHLADRFDEVSGDAWNRTGRRSDGASFTIVSFARYMIHDPIHHLVDVGASDPASGGSGDES